MSASYPRSAAHILLIRYRKIPSLVLNTRSCASPASTVYHRRPARIKNSHQARNVGRNKSHKRNDPYAHDATETRGRAKTRRVNSRDGPEDIKLSAVDHRAPQGWWRLGVERHTVVGVMSLNADTRGMTRCCLGITLAVRTDQLSWLFEMDHGHALYHILAARTDQRTCVGPHIWLYERDP